MWRPMMLALSLGAGLARPALATEPKAERLRLSEVVEEARQHNPAIQAARERARAAAAMPVRAAAYDDPTLSWESWNIPPSVAVDQADNNIVRLSQKIPFPGKRSLAGTAAEHDAEVARREADAVELDVIAGAKRAYYDLWEAHQNLLVYAREKVLVERFAHVAEQKYALGQVSQSDVLRAQVELTRLQNRITTATLAIDGVRAELDALLSRESDQPFGVPEDVAPPRLDGTPDTLTEQALRERPELAAQQAAVAREDTGLRLAHRNYLPDFEFAVGRFFNANQRDGFGALASVTIPLAYKAKYDAGVAEATARLDAAHAELRRLQDRIRREVRQAFLRARAALLQHDLFVSTHIPQAEQSLRVTESGYQTGAVDFLSLVDTVRAIESVHLEHIQAAGEFEKASADLERMVGGPLPRIAAR